MTTLPRLIPRETLYHSQLQSDSRAKVYATYPPRLASSYEDFSRLPNRVNPLRPPAPQRMHTSLTTADAHFHNDKRRDMMQKMEHHRYHNAWSKYYYGSPSDQEAHRKRIRDTLKQQMAEQWHGWRVERKSKSSECQEAFEMDKRVKEEDRAEAVMKSKKMKTYRDENKKQMEDLWKSQKKTKRSEDLQDREQLKYNPINWSCTLK